MIGSATVKQKVILPIKLWPINYNQIELLFYKIAQDIINRWSESYHLRKLNPGTKKPLQWSKRFSLTTSEHSVNASSVEAELAACFGSFA